VVIINEGRVVAQDLVENLESGRGSAIQVTLKRPSSATAQSLGRVKGVTEVQVQGDGVFALRLATGADPREEVSRLCVNEGWGLLEQVRRRATLEDVFLQLTTTDEGHQAAL